MNPVDKKRVFECYLKSNNFESAIKVCYETNMLDKIEGQIRPALLVACDLQTNQMRQVLQKFDQRMLRLKIVQNSKRSMPTTDMFGADRNFELDSENLSVSNASSSAYSQSNRSGRSSSSGFSETSKKSKRI